MARYLHEQKSWPDFRWKRGRIERALGEVRFRQGLWLGRMQALDEGRREEVAGAMLAAEVEASATLAGGTAAGLAGVMAQAAFVRDTPLSRSRLSAWHASLIRGGGALRKGRFEVMDGDRVRFRAPDADRVATELGVFLKWVDKDDGHDPLLAAALAHLWFMTLRPFGEGDGRVGRALTALMLARAEGEGARFYSFSAALLADRVGYEAALEAAQRGDGDVTAWLAWFLPAIGRALEEAEALAAPILARAAAQQRWSSLALNDRQRLMLAKLADGLDGKLTTQAWARTTGASHDSALRDIKGLIEQGVLTEHAAGGRSTSYGLK